VTHTFRIALLALALLTVPVVASANPTEAQQSGASSTRSGTIAQRILARARLVHRRGELTSNDLSALLDDARARHDARFVRCLDRRLAEVNAHLRMIRNRYQSLARAVETRDARETRRMLDTIERLGRRIGEVETEAYACPGARVRSREGSVELEVTRPDAR
jgi:hypothetical protein